MKARSFALGLGGNLGNVKDAFRACARRLGDEPRAGSLRFAPVYETPPWGDAGGGNFLNTAVSGLWSGSDRSLLELCREMELSAGSVTVKNGKPRTLDVDVLFLEGGVSSEELILPHPLLVKRRFVLVPLSEVWNGPVPGLGISPAELLKTLDDSSFIIFRGTLEQD